MEEAESVSLGSILRTSRVMHFQKQTSQKINPVMGWQSWGTQSLKQPKNKWRAASSQTVDHANQDNRWHQYCMELTNQNKSTTNSPTLQTGNIHQCSLGPIRMLVFHAKKINGGGTMTFGHGYNQSSGELDGCCNALKIRALQWALTAMVSWALWSTWIEYMGTSKLGTGFPNIEECLQSWSRSS